MINLTNFTLIPRHLYLVELTLNTKKMPWAFLKVGKNNLYGDSRQLPDQALPYKHITYYKRRTRTLL